MPATRISLDQIRINDPCPMAWDDLKGDDSSRFCAHCNRHVHNLSAISEDEAQRLVCASAGRLCVAYVPDAQGGVTPLAYREQRRPRYGWKLVAAIAGFGGVVSALTTAVYGPKPAPPPAPAPMILGAIRIAPAPATPGSCAEPAPDAQAT